MSEKEESTKEQLLVARILPAITRAFSKLIFIVCIIVEKLWFVKAAVILAIVVLYTTYYLSISDSYNASKTRYFWNFFADHRYFQENEKMKDITARITEVSDKWDYLRDFDPPVDVEQRYVKEHIIELYSVLESVDPIVFEYRQRVMYHYIFIKVHIIYSALKKDASYLDNIEEHTSLIREIMSSKGNTYKDMKFYMQYMFIDRLQHMEFNIAALRRLYSTQPVAEGKLEQALELFGGCDELRRRGVIFKPFYVASGCSK